jgi:hypothetical protein
MKNAEHLLRVDSHAEAPQFGVEIRGKDPITIMENETIGVVKGQELAKLLGSPLRRRMRGDITVQDPPRTDLHGGKYIQNPKVCGDGNEEIAHGDAREQRFRTRVCARLSSIPSVCGSIAVWSFVGSPSPAITAVARPPLPQVSSLFEGSQQRSRYTPPTTSTLVVHFE